MNSTPAAPTRLKVVTVLGTRPEIIRLSRVIAVLDKVTDHVLVHTGQNYDYELNEIFFKDLGIRTPDKFLEAVGETAAATVGMVIAKADLMLKEVKPDAMLVLGDTNSGLAVLSAKRLKIPIFHMEAGNRSFDIRVPEETNRRIIDHVSDINLPYSDISRDYLLREGFPPDRVIKTGRPMFEVLEHYRPQIDSSQILQNLKVRAKEYFVVSCHREENVDAPEQLAKLVQSLNLLAERYKKTIVFSVHPRTRKRLEGLSAPFHPLVQTLKPLGFTDYVRLQKEAFCVLSDSGTISEEASILGLKAVNIREAHERPEGMEETVALMTGLNPERILQAVAMVTHPELGRSQNLVRDYATPVVSEKIARIILSYTDYVNRTVWFKS